jgi:sporulation protein YlmC with PRC-barrel domain
MKRRPSTTFLTVALLAVLMLVLTACPQDQPQLATPAPAQPVAPAAQPATPVAPAAQPGAPAVQPGAPATVAGAQEALYTASSLLGLNFENIDGQVSGNIEDILVDAHSGQILMVMIEYGGFLGLGDTRFAVPLNAFTWGTQGELVLNIDEATLENYPDLGADWPNVADPTWDDQIVQFWRGAGLDPGFEITEQTQTVVRISELIGFGAADFGYGAGNVDDILIDLSQGQARYVVLDYGTAFWDDDLAAVPFTAFDPQTLQTGAWGTDPAMDPAALQGAPRIQRGAGTTVYGRDATTQWDTYWQPYGYPVGAPATTAPAAPAQPATPAQPAAPAAPGAVAPGPGIAGGQDVMMFASTLLDYNVRSIDGQITGDIDDLLIDINSGRILYATLNYGGFLGIGQTALPVPLSVLSWDAGNELVVHLDEQTLDNMPDLGADWPNLADPNWDDQLVGFWQSVGVDPGFDVAAETGVVMWVSELINYGFTGFTTQESNIHDLLVDLGQSQARYAVIDLDPGVTATAEDQLIVVPFQAVAMDAAGGPLVFDPGFDQNLLQGAPRMDPGLRDQAPVLDQTSVAVINDYWQAHGYQ